MLINYLIIYIFDLEVKNWNIPAYTKNSIRS